MIYLLLDVHDLKIIAVTKVGSYNRYTDGVLVVIMRDVKTLFWRFLIFVNVLRLRRFFILVTFYYKNISINATQNSILMISLLHVPLLFSSTFKLAM